MPPQANLLSNYLTQSRRKEINKQYIKITYTQIIITFEHCYYSVLSNCLTRSIRKEINEHTTKTNNDVYSNYHYVFIKHYYYVLSNYSTQSRRREVNNHTTKGTITYTV